MWGELSNEAKRFVGEMEEILSPSNSYKRYRGILNSGINVYKCLYLNLSSTDPFFFQELPLFVHIWGCFCQIWWQLTLEIQIKSEMK